MRNRISSILSLTILLLVLHSCGSSRIQNSPIEHGEPGNPINLDNENRDRESFTDNDITYEEVSLFGIKSVINNSDTLIIQEIICTDSLVFIEAFSEIKVREMCIEAGIQGTTYYQVEITEDGTFQNVIVLNHFSDCLLDFEEKIKIRLLELEVLDKDVYNSELIFYHKLIIEEE